MKIGYLGYIPLFLLILSLYHAGWGKFLLFIGLLLIIFLLRVQLNDI